MELEAIWQKIAQNPPLGFQGSPCNHNSRNKTRGFFRVKKIGSNLCDSAQLGGCIALTCASKEIHLNASALSNPKSLMPSVTLLSYTIPSFSMLVDSDSSNCFIDTNFVNKHSLSTYSVPLLKLCLFDRTMNSTITQAIALSSHFKTSDITLTSFYVTPLDGSCSPVLGHNWLTHNNPLIEWTTSSISFHSPEQSVLANLHTSPQPSTPPSSTEPPTYDLPCFSDCKAPHIALVSTPAFTLACCLEGSVQYSMQLCSASTIS